MHNLALALASCGAEVTGSDDEIYEPSRTRLDKAGLLPTQMGWNPDRISNQLDKVIVGMHAKADNPELLKAQKLGVNIVSYPEFIFENSVHKKRVVIAGSHGKTTTTSMIMHVLQRQNIAFDYLLGAQLAGFERMVHLSDAPLIVIEGDEYLSAPTDLRPKFLHYKPHISVLTGIELDHVNVFKSEEEYFDQFRLYLKSIQHEGVLYYYGENQTRDLVNEENRGYRTLEYEALGVSDQGVHYENENYPVGVFGAHNRSNMHAALLVCQELGVRPEDFLRAMVDFKGAGNRLEIMFQDSDRIVYRDYAHAPSKVRATIKAMREKYPAKKIIALFELHTYSSLSIDFIPRYQGAFNPADEVLIAFDPHAVKMKRLPELKEDEVMASIEHPNLIVANQGTDIISWLDKRKNEKAVFLFMSSGNWFGLNQKKLYELEL